MPKLPLYGQPGQQWYICPRRIFLAALIEVFSGMTRCGIFTKGDFSIAGMPEHWIQILPKNKTAACNLA